MSSAAGAPRTAEVIQLRVFAVATGLGLLHALDDALLNRQPGVPVGQHLPALVASVLVVAGALWWFRRARPGIRAGLALTLGSWTLTNGAMHVIHVAVDHTSRSDLTGVLAALAGVALIGLGVVVPFSSRERVTRSRGRRWMSRATAATAAVVLIPTVVVPVAVAIGQTHKFREPIPPPPSDRYHTVTFEASDGLTLEGWYVPSRNGAAVLLVNSAGGDRTGSVEHAQLLAEHGYGVLLYDARGSGESEGSPNGYGWSWDRDVSGALTFLRHRPDVDPARIGGLGLSTGADVLLEVAAEDPTLAAVVADGATSRSVADLPAGGLLEKPGLWTMFTAVRLLSGTSPGPSLEQLVAEVSPTPLLLIAAGSIPAERELNAGYAAAAAEPVELWDLPHVTHTAAIREEAAAYEARVTGLFDQALAQPPVVTAR